MERTHEEATEEKAAILRRHLLGKEPISKLCDELGLQPKVFCRWQKEIFENGASAFAQKKPSNHSAGQERIASLEKKLKEIEATTKRQPLRGDNKISCRAGKALAPELFDDEPRGEIRPSPVAPAARSPEAREKAHRQRTADGWPVPELPRPAEGLGHDHQESHPAPREHHAGFHGDRSPRPGAGLRAQAAAGQTAGQV